MASLKKPIILRKVRIDAAVDGFYDFLKICGGSFEGCVWVFNHIGKLFLGITEIIVQDA